MCVCVLISTSIWNFRSNYFFLSFLSDFFLLIFACIDTNERELTSTPTVWIYFRVYEKRIPFNDFFSLLTKNRKEYKLLKAKLWWKISKVRQIQRLKCRPSSERNSRKICVRIQYVYKHMHTWICVQHRESASRWWSFSMYIIHVYNVVDRKFYDINRVDTYLLQILGPFRWGIHTESWHGILKAFNLFNSNLFSKSDKIEFFMFASHSPLTGRCHSVRFEFPLYFYAQSLLK